jgi:dTDP-4-dehydrorhamnose reductase
MRILVTGAAGQLGHTVVERFSSTADVIPLTRQDLDITSAAAVLEAVRAARPDVIINCAAYNQVDAAQSQPMAALEINAFAVLALARAARDVSATLVHYSSDFVFDGGADRPYTEEDATAPQSHYGLSKLLGEWFAAETSPAYVLRVESLFGGPRARSSVDAILGGIEAGRPVRVFTDRTVTPSYVEDVAGATARLLDRQPEPGIYHSVNSGITTWLGIAEEAARLVGRTPELVPMRMEEARLVAPRPLYCALSNDKLARAGIPMPAWQDGLARYVEERRRRA